MQTKTQNLLPKTAAGTVHVQFVRCGKSNCRCVRGQLHGAYYYHFVRVGGRLRKRYLKPSEVDEVRTACLRRQQLTRARADALNADWKALRRLRAELGELRHLYT